MKPTASLRVNQFRSVSMVWKKAN